MTTKKLLIDRFGHSLPAETVNRALEVFASLNEEQRKACVDISLGPPPSTEGCYLPIIHGPPGTGKTLVICVGTLLYLARRAPSRTKTQVVIVTFTNYAADQVVRTFKEQFDFDPHLLKRLAWKVFDNELEEYYEKRHPTQLRHQEKQDLEAARVFAVTAHSAGRARHVASRPLVIFDEVSQINTPLFIQGSVNFRMTAQNKDVDYICLVGDPNQLPNVTHQSELRVPIINYLVRGQPDGVMRAGDVHILRTQYRMHPTICRLVNSLGALTGMPPLESQPDATRTLDPHGFLDQDDLPSWVREVLKPENPLVLVDTSDLPGWEVQEASTANPNEARLVSSIWRAFQEAYRSPPDGGRMPILTPYALQRTHIENELGGPGLVRTVDEVQGREFDVVIFSGVRQNPLGFIGFVGEFPRIFVACSRARSKLVLVLSADTFRGDIVFDSILDFFQDGVEGAVSLRLSPEEADLLMRQNDHESRKV